MHLSALGIKAPSKDRFTMLVITGNKVGKHFIKTEAGRGPRAWVLTLIDLIRLAMYSVETH